MSLDHRIGTLNSGKFYCFPNGNGKPEFVGTLDEVEAALGIKGTSAPIVTQAKKACSLRDYLVTVEPKIVTYAGANTFSEYTITISALSHTEAIKLARQKRSDIEGRHGVPATYRAKLIR